MMDEELNDTVPAYEFLTELGFTEDVATQIVIRLLLSQLEATVPEIRAASEECGYTLPLITLAVEDYKTRN